MIAKDNGSELQYRGSKTHFGENISPIDVSQDLVPRSIRERIHLRCLEIEGKSFMCPSLEDDELASFHEVL